MGGQKSIFVLLQEDNHFLLKKMIYSLFIGIFGTIILSAFISSFMYFETLKKFIPWIIGFNAAMTLYNFIEKTKEKFVPETSFVLMLGALMVSLSFLGLNMIFFYFTRYFLFNFYDFIIYLIAGLIFAKLGSLVAIKYFRLKS